MLCFLQLDSVLEKYPSFRLVLDFVRDIAWSKQRFVGEKKDTKEQSLTIARFFLTFCSKSPG